MTGNRKHGIAAKPDRAMALVVGALLTLPAAAAAQQEGPPHRHGQGPAQAQPGTADMMTMGTHRHGPMMGMMGSMGMMSGPGPMMILRQREALDLTEEQVTGLEALRERMAQTRAEHMESVRPLHERLVGLAGDPALDLDAYESTLRSLAEEHVAVHVAMARIGQRAREALTPEQREKLHTGMEFMRGMRMEGMQGRMGRTGSGGAGSMPGMMPCPMPGGDLGEGG